MPPKKVQPKGKQPTPTVTAKSKKDAKATAKNTKVVAKQAAKTAPAPKTGRSKSASAPSPLPTPKIKKGAVAAKSVSPPPATPKTAKGKGGKAKAKSPSPQKKVQIDSKDLKKVVFTGSAPVDDCVLGKDDYVVYENAGKIYDCAMNQTNIVGANNNNKYYIVQLLKHKTQNTYFVFNRWGRVGVPGQQAMFPFSSNLAAAIQAYEKKIHEKSVKGDYRVLEKDYSGENNDPKAQQEKEKSKAKKEKEAFDKSKLHQKVKELVRLIFDMNMMNQQMKEIGYDAKKMPLGKLAASTIKKGFDVLKEISDELDQKKPNVTRLQTLTSEFYSQIPHDFGFQKAPVINTKEVVKKKLDMLEAIQHIQVATKILDENQEDENLIDQNFKKLNIDMKYLDHNNEKVKLIKQYIKNTQEDYDLEVLDVFELTKDQDDKRFKKDLGNRLLLWHGSRLTNFVGILGQGLRIAPPEAPATGYRFGKGVYLADMVAKSADYCCPSHETKTGLILLCDSALGNQNIKLSDDYNASKLPAGKHSTWAKAKSYPPASSYVDMPGMPGVKVPIGKPVPSDVKDKSIMWHNEFIVYDVAQVRLKYLIKMKWNGNVW